MCTSALTTSTFLTTLLFAGCGGGGSASSSAATTPVAATPVATVTPTTSITTTLTTIVQEASLKAAVVSNYTVGSNSELMFKSVNALRPPMGLGHSCRTRTLISQRRIMQVTFRPIRAALTRTAKFQASQALTVSLCWTELSLPATPPPPPLRKSSALAQPNVWLTHGMESPKPLYQEFDMTLVTFARRPVTQSV